MIDHIAKYLTCSLLVFHISTSIYKYFCNIPYCSKVWCQIICLKEITTFIQQGCINLIKSDSKGIFVTKDFYFM